MCEAVSLLESYAHSEHLFVNLYIEVVRMKQRNKTFSEIKYL